jgi:hypothetical protein
MTMERVHPKTTADYFAVLTRAVFQAGFSWSTVDAKWEGFQEAFAGFNPEAVADFSPEDVESLLGDTRIIRNRRKVVATVHNAQAMLDVEREFTSFKKYLDSFGGDYQKTVADLERRFEHVGDTGAWYFMAVIGRPVPDWTVAHPGDTWTHHAHRGEGHAARRPSGAGRDHHHQHA